ncbi:MAG: PQQ-binding-like beta-propeller repeat protein [Candidatus Aenigmatarchaeota archaeon]
MRTPSVAVLVAVAVAIIFFIFFFGKQPLPEGYATTTIAQPSGGNPPGAGGYHYNIPQIDSNRPLPNLPEGEWITKQLGDVEIRFFTTSIIRGMSESGTDYFITLKNKGPNEAIVNFSSDQELVKYVPQCNLHFFSFQNPGVKIAPGAEKKLWYFASIDSNACDFTVNFKLWPGANENNIVELPVKFGSVDDNFRNKETGIIKGFVKDESGKPVKNARIDFLMNCGRMGARADTDENGFYAAAVLAMEDINAIYGTREIACDAYDYFASVDAEGYEYYFKDHIAPTRTQYVDMNITLQKKKDVVSYSKKWEKKADDNYGFFWVKPSSDWSVFAADQAKHPPELGKPTNFYLFDSNGNVLWKQATGNECWGIDIAQDGSKVVAGCHDKYVYSVDKSGTLLWKYEEPAMIRSACLSKDGTKILSGGLQKLHLFNSQDGSKRDVSWIDEWFRNCAFYSDDSGFIVGARTVAAFNINANKLWDYVIGEFPMFLGVDNSKNVYASGKSRTLFSWDAQGGLRWKHRIPDHVAGAGASTPDGSRIAIGTVGGMVYLFDNAGNLLWKRNTGIAGEQGTVGHNAVAISPDGKRIVAGTAPGNCVIVYNENGTMVWKSCEQAQKITGLLEGATNVQISPDNSKVIASYGDNYVRMFEAL